MPELTPDPSVYGMPERKACLKYRLTLAFKACLTAVEVTGPVAVLKTPSVAAASVVNAIADGSAFVLCSTSSYCHSH